ncbi:alpha/beta fold hydrolase [Aeromonas veronii]|uniref:alpha/beta fold hydrolase n=1 Tax=Aeromonas veronii TaxID=654 RepID=UPI001931EF65|nr:alpha/beta fold hydrolase [Aeromonas veronii]MBM0416110.1 alpha/beta fold hydrolase [Aeromonas veronii]MBW3789038.1 alpha/beta fold hydrolase [Aeromonas veronii]
MNFKEQGQGPAVILIHGLFGSLDNLGLLARALGEHYRVISVDLRNHGVSFRSDDMSYPAQAADILALMDHLGLDQAAIVGHSMGGKVGMQLAKLAPARVSRLVVVDMAPVAYPHSRHQNVFAGLNATLRTPPQSRSETEAMLAQHIEIAGVRQFLLKSFARGEHGWGWRFNVPALEQNYANIMGWPDDERRFEGPVLFIKGGNSDYMQPQYSETALAQFPAAKVRVIAGTGHWLHAEKPALFNKLVVDFLSTGG